MQQLVEVVQITPELSIELELPVCELQLDRCSGTPTHGVRVHGCAFHYACPECATTFRQRVSGSYKSFDKMRCTNCHISYNKSTYYKIVRL